MDENENENEKQIMECACVLLQVSWKKECLVLYVLQGLLVHRAGGPLISHAWLKSCLVLDTADDCSASLPSASSDSLSMTSSSTTSAACDLPMSPLRLLQLMIRLYRCDSWSVGLFDVSCFMRGCSGFLYTFCMYSRKLVHVQWTGTVARDSRPPVL